MKQRDNQRSKVYKSERACSKWRTDYIHDIKEIKKYVYKILNSKTINSKFGKLTPEIKDGRGCRRAMGSKDELIFPISTRFKLIILHEIAHALTPSVYAYHGIEFCSNYLMLVKHYLGDTVRLELATQFNLNNVKFKFNTFMR